MVKKIVPLELIKDVLSSSKKNLKEWEVYLADDSFYQLMEQEGLVGLVYHRFQEEMDEKILSRWRQAYLSTASYNTLLIHHLAELYKVFQKHRIEPILLKGAALFFGIYRDNLGVRPLCDVDMFIQSGHLEQLKSCLKDFQFVQSPHYTTTFTKKLSYGNMVVDIHTELVSIDRVPSRSHLSVQISNLSKCRLDFNKTAFWIPKDEDHFIYLCVHLTLHHGMERALWLWDLTQISSSKHFNWDKVLDKSKEWQAKKIIYFTLLKLQQLTSINVPNHVLKQLQPQNITWIEQKCWGMGVSHLCIPNLRYALTFFLFDNLKDKLVYLKELLFPKSGALKTFFHSGHNTNRVGNVILYLLMWVKIMAWSFRWIWALLRNSRARQPLG